MKTRLITVLCAVWMLAGCGSKHPSLAGDAGNAGAGGSDGGADCKTTASSTLPGVHILVDDSVCEFTLAQALAGLHFNYQVVVDDDVAGVTPARQDSGGCQSVHTSGLFLGERISGGAENYCICDTGLCAPGTIEAMTLKAGSYAGTFDWDGHNWGGPSDTRNPEGPAFPAGTYTFLVRSTGASTTGNFEVKGTLQFTLK